MPSPSLSPPSASSSIEPSQLSSIPLHTSAAPGCTAAKVSSQSDELVDSPASRQSASALVRVVVEPNPSPSASRKQTSCPSQLSSLLLPTISVAPGWTAATASLQSTAVPHPDCR